MANRWWTYQRERFPVFAHTPIIAAFSLSAVSYSALIRGAYHVPGWKPCVVAFASSFLFFLQLQQFLGHKTGGVGNAYLLGRFKQKTILSG